MEIKSSCNLKHGLEENEILHFLHIPKAAGTTLISILDGYFDKEEVLRLHAWKYLLPKMPLDFSKFRFVRGHYGYGFYRLLPKKPINITLLRDPTDIILSSYKMIQRQPEEAKRYSIPQDKTISELITDPKIEGLVDTQTHWLAIDLDVLELSKDMDLEELSEYQPEEHNYFKHPNMSDQELLDTAKKHLSEFAFVGVVEKFEESLFLLHYMFGWPPIRNTVKKNVAPEHKTSDDLTEGAKKKLEEWTKLDQELYKYGNKIFEEHYSKMVSNLKEKYWKSEYGNMETNEAIFEMLKEHHEDHFGKDASKPSLKSRIRGLISS
ncbi:sulfotransferase family 2 domain-containing protein [Nitrosopumilus sp. K4]|uniref:sulfotransferase family 2 domain-containing protein n=1 Tax=Nitrosopumilus sp. K4 TaxID=2795383 RepID=UPI001BA795DB|nr:sulfotransferase family 2 domain-containing protein [Nitrosopumilus sp. K4]QUC64795.1 sulfotransferase family 2 domain-containing protein [Nitrosopumilus sp. K4]